MVTQRQEKILKEIVKEYVKSAKPVSSSLLKKKGALDISSATVRNEMKELEREGYLKQPHTSAGRIPTNKAYRLFVDKLEESEDSSFKRETVEKEIKDIFKLMESVTKSLASDCNSLALSYISEKDFFFEEGWKEVFKNPEFERKEFLSEFTESLDNLEKKIKDIIKENSSEIHVFIGKEKSVLNSSDISLIVSKARFPRNQHGILALLGPSRMAYDKNIRILDSLIKELESF